MMPMELPNIEVARDVVLHKSGTQPEAAVADRQQCLTCAFGVLMLSPEAQAEDREQAVATISEAQETASYNVRTRATIYRCGVTACRRAFIALTMVNQQPIPTDGGADICLEALPSTTSCLIPQGDSPQILSKA